MHPTPLRDPTPEEIRQACLRIQQSWSPAERRRRIVDDATANALRLRYVIPILPADAFTGGLANPDGDAAFI